MKTYIQNLLRGAPCDYAEVRYHEVASTSLAFDGKGLKNVGRHAARGCFIRALVRGQFGTAATEDLDRLPAYLELAIKSARLREGTVPRFAPVEKAVADVEIRVDRPAHAVDLDEKVALVAAYNDLLLRNPRIPGTATHYGDSYEKRIFANTEGTAVSFARPRIGLSLRPIASEGGVVQMSIRNVGGIFGFDRIIGREAEVEALAAHAASLLDAEPVVGGTYDVIVDPMLAGIFAHEAFGHTAEADEIYADPALQEIMAVGRRFGPETLSIVDDATLQGPNGFTPFDDEGVPGKRKYLLREGVLASLLHNRETATRAGVAPTGNARAIDYHFPPIIRMTSTYIEAGPSTFDEMLASVPRGIYARRAKGGTGGETFSFTAEDGYLIENGRLTKHIRDLKLQGNLFRTLENVAAVGNDFVLPDEGVGGCGKGGQSPLPVATGGPHLLIRGVQIGGR